MLIHKHITLNFDTTVALEPVFWDAIELLDHDWLARQLSSKPHDQGRASWIRQQVLREFMQARVDRIDSFRNSHG